jgi:type VI secretion system protein ImpE
MTAKDLYQAGKLKEAIQALNGEVRDNPADVRRRTFLFELLTFAGEYDRAQKQLQVLADSSGDAKLGTVLYLSALHAEKTRKETFAKGDYPTHVADAAETPLTGTLNGRRFATVVDADPRIGPRLDCYAAGAYIWIPFKHIEEIEAMPPKRVRDLIWIPALVRTGPEFKAMRGSAKSCCPPSPGTPAWTPTTTSNWGASASGTKATRAKCVRSDRRCCWSTARSCRSLELRKLVFDRAEAAPATEATEE